MRDDVGLVLVLPAESVQPPDALLHPACVPGVVEVNQFGGELEVAALPAGLVRDHDPSGTVAAEAADVGLLLLALEVAAKLGDRLRAKADPEPLGEVQGHPGKAGKEEEFGRRRLAAPGRRREEGDEL